MIGPELFIDRLWLNDDDIAGGVQIIELKSSDGSDASQDKNKGDQENSQKNNYDQFQISDPRSVNANAREKRRLKNQSPQYQNQFAEKNINYVFDTTYDNDNFYKDFYASPSNTKDENVVANHQMNCFTILDKHYTDISENSSAEDFDNIEVIDCDNLPPGYTLNNCTHEEDLVPYDMEADVEKRMVWIYSFKNKRLLSDNDFELVNIPSQDLSAAQSSIENLPELNDLDKNFRAATPIPPTFVPRLNLTMTSTLPTVAEAIEPSEQLLSPKGGEEIPNEQVKRKPLNNWFYSENATPTSKEESCTGMEKSTNVVDWMALSPREKRRRLNSSSSRANPCKYHFPITCEGNFNKENVNFEITNPFSDNYLYNGGNEKQTSSVEENRDTHKDKIVTSLQNNDAPKQKTATSKQKADTSVQKNNTPKRKIETPKQKTDNFKQKANTSIQETDMLKRKIDISIQKTGSPVRKTCTPTKQVGNTLAQKIDDVHLFRTVRSESSTPPASSTRRELHYSKITTMEIVSDEQDTPEDRGDYIKRPQTKRPHIRIIPHPGPGSAISNPIENLNSNDWITENSSEVNNDDREKAGRPKEYGDGVGNVIFMKHMSLFKPAEWEAYLPITESVPSLCLSMNTDLENNSRSWLKRLYKFFLCCK